MASDFSRLARWAAQRLAIAISLGLLVVVPQLCLAQVSTSINLSVTIPPDSGNIVFNGNAFPEASVTFLNNNAVAGTTVADPTSAFTKTLTALTPGVHTFGIYGTDSQNRTTLMLSFDLNIVSGGTITVSGILLPPILSVPTSTPRSQPFEESGLAKSSSTVTTFTDNHGQISQQTQTDTTGQWRIAISQVLHLGVRAVTALVNDGLGNQSVVTNPQNITVLISANLNNDSKTDITDFSILMYNYGSHDPTNKAADINDDGPVDLVDFSVMMFNWTG